MACTAMPTVVCRGAPFDGATGCELEAGGVPEQAEDDELVDDALAGSKRELKESSSPRLEAAWLSLVSSMSAVGPAMPPALPSIDSKVALAMPPPVLGGLAPLEQGGLAGIATSILRSTGLRREAEGVDEEQVGDGLELQDVAS